MNANPKPRVSLKFARFTIAQLIEFGRHVVISLTGNPDFTTPSPTPAATTTSVDALEAADQAALNGDRIALSARKAAKADTVDTLRQLAAYIQNQGQEDRTIMLGSGFELNRIPAPIGPLPPPGAPIVAHGLNDGEIKARIVRPNGTSSVNWRLALASAPSVYLQTVSTPGGRYTFKGLTAGEVYLVQASVVGTEGVSSWGPASSLMAL
jgi:hypothetical protein